MSLPVASGQSAPAPKLPIGARSAGAPSIEELLCAPSPSRRRAPKPAAAVGSPARALLSSSPGAGGSSYRERLRASGVDALHRVHSGATPGGSPLASPCGSPSGKGMPPMQLSFGAVPTQMGPGHDAAARTPPVMQLEQQLPYSPYCGAPQVVTWTDVSPSTMASTSFVTPGGSSGMASFFDMGQSQVASFQVPPPQQQQQVLSCEPSPQQQVPDLMATAMPHAACCALDGEQIAAQLRAAAPDSYED